MYRCIGIIQYRAKTQTFLQFSIDGNQIGTGDNQNLTLGLGGYWEAVTPLSEDSGGNNLHAALLHGTYDPTGAQILTATVKTDVTAI